MSRVVTAVGCLRDRGASHPGSIGIKSFALVRVRMTNLTTTFHVEITILPSSYHRVTHITYLYYPYDEGPV